jgi:hypothetical protein
MEAMRRLKRHLARRYHRLLMTPSSTACHSLDNEARST